MRRHCHYCDFTALKGSTMSMHVSMKHSLHKKHQCPLCSEKFAEKTQLQHHFVNNHCDPDIPCGFPGCTFLFKNTTTQRMHYVRCHMKDKVIYSSSSMKGYKICLTCNTFLKRANMMYHLAQCSPDSPFCTNTAAMEQRRAAAAAEVQPPSVLPPVEVLTAEEKNEQIISMLAEMDDLDEDFFQEDKEETLDDIIERVLF